ncbi:MAG: copper chaperone PCu(A)C [Pikeienuella sp.]
MNWLRISLSSLVVLGAVVALWLAGAGASSKITLTNARASVHNMDGAEAIAVTLDISNQGDADRVIFASSPDAKLAIFHGVTDLSGAPVPAGATPSLSLDGAHIMLLGVKGDLVDGRLIPLTVSFANAGDVSTKATLSVAAGAMDMSGQGMTHSVDHAGGLTMPTDSAPRVSVRADPADGGAWRIITSTDRFTFAPAAMDGAHVVGEGHGHLYIGGLKIMRMTSHEVVIGALPPGRHEVRITLNTNNHMVYRTDEGPVSATTFIDVPD